MSQETLSALMDGECSEAEIDAILAEFEASEATRDRWSRMCLTRDALSGSQFSVSDVDICGKVMAAIAAEPVVAAPRPMTAPVSPKVVQIAARRADRNRWQQPLIGVAAAASIAGAVVLGGNSLLSSQTGTRVAADQGARSLPVSTKTDVASGDASETRWAQLDSDSARELNGYVMEHSNYRAEQGMGGSLSYARMAVRTADYHPASEQH